MDFDFIGSGGGGKGGGSGGGAPREDPNTLRSRSTARILELISEGEIEGLVNGSQSIFFDDTPLQAVDGSYNFKNVGWQIRYGLQDQDAISGFTAVESTNQVGVEVTQSSPVVRTITDPTVDAVRVAVRLPALTFTDTETSALQGSSVSFNIDVRPYGGDWYTPTLNRSWQSFVSKTLPDSTGIMVTVSNMSPALQANETLTFGLEYRRIGDAAWTSLPNKSVSVANDAYAEPLQNNG